MPNYDPFDPKYWENADVFAPDQAPPSQQGDIFDPEYWKDAADVTELQAQEPQEFAEVPRETTQAGALPQPQGGVKASDYFKQLMQGFAGAGRMLSFFSRAYNPMTYLGLATEATGALTGKEELARAGELIAESTPGARAARQAQQAQQYWQESLSPAMKREMAKPFITRDEQGKWKPGPGLKSAPKIFGIALQSLPLAGIGMLSGGAITGSLIAGGMSSGLAGVIGGAIGEGITAGVSNAQQTYDQIYNAPDKLIKKSPEYQEIINSLPEGLSAKEKDRLARKALALAGATFVGTTTTLTTGALGAPSGHIFGRIVGGEAGPLWKAIIKETLSESLIEEAPQSAIEQLVQNMAEKYTVNPEKVLTEGMGEQAIGGALAAAVTTPGIAVGGHVMGKQGRAKAPVAPAGQPIYTKEQVDRAKQFLKAVQQDYRQGRITKQHIDAIKRGLTQDDPLTNAIKRKLDRIIEIENERRAKEAQPIDLVEPIKEAIPVSKSAEESARAFEEHFAREEYLRQSPFGLQALNAELAERERQARVEALGGLAPYISDLLTQVKMGEPGGRIQLPEGKWIGYSSTYPEFMREGRFGREETITTIEKGLRGEEFSERETRRAAIWDAVVRHAEEARKRDIIDVAKLIEQRPEQIKDITDDEYHQIIEELKNEGYSTRLIEEARARYRSEIEDSVISEIAKESGVPEGYIRAILEDEKEPYIDLDEAWKEALAAGEEVPYDREKEGRVLRGEREAGQKRPPQKPGRPVQEQGGGGEEAGAGGVFQEVSPHKGKPSAEVASQQAEHIKAAAEEAETEPSAAQIEAGNYKKGHIEIGGLKISIENPAGSTRKSKPGAPEKWESKLYDHYGYIRRTEAPDGDQVDVFINPEPRSSLDTTPVFIVYQNDPKTGKFDEYKVMLGYLGEKQARVAYLRNYPKGWKGLGKIERLESIGDLKEWLKENAAPKKKPYTGPERRKDLEKRKKVEEMTPEEMRRELLTDHLTGLPNRRAFDEAEKKAYIASIDVDSLKWYNDKIGHDFGDQVLKVMADALKSCGLPIEDVFHISGDEFKAQANTAGELIKAFKKAIEYLSSNILEGTFYGTEVLVEVGFSYGIGQTEEEAEKALQSHKRARLRAGTRARRGERPPGVVVKSAGEREGGIKEKPEKAGPSIAPEILPPKQQTGNPEKRIAKLLHAHGLEARVMQGEDFYAKISSEGYLDLVIERHLLPNGKDQGLYITHYVKEGGDLVLDSEMVFGIGSNGKLILLEVAGRGPLGEWRTSGQTRDGRSFADIFSKNIISQGFLKGKLTFPGEKETAKDIGKPGNFNIPALAKRFEALIDINKKPLNKVALQKEVAQMLGTTRPKLLKDPNYSHKQVEEAFEYAIVRKARDIIEKNKGRPYQEVYKELKKLYEWQPNLGTRTSTSVAKQAYSTPIHLAYLMQVMVGVNPNTTVYEPTAGTGSLLTVANPRMVFANEIDPTRAEILEDQGFNVSQEDGKEAVAPKGKGVVVPGSMDVVIGNPPFGSEEWEDFEGYELKKLEHKIMANALKAMSYTGRAAFLIGGHNFEKGKMSNADRIFLNYLHKNYKVIRNIDIPGKEYARQGTKFNVRLIVIDGKKTKGATDIFTSADPSNRAEFQRVKTIDELVDETGRIYSGQPTSLAAADGTMEKLSPQPGPRPSVAPYEGGGEGVHRPVRGQGSVSGGGHGERGEHGERPTPSGQLASGVQPANQRQSKPGGRGPTTHGMGKPTAHEGGVQPARPTERPHEPGGVSGERGPEQGRPSGLRERGRGEAGHPRSEPDALSGIADVSVDQVNPADLLSAFDQLVEQEKSATERAKEKGKETIEYAKKFAEGIKKINEILGEKGEIFSSEPVDPSKYEQIKEVLNEMYHDALATGKSALDFVKEVFAALSEKARPYFSRWLQDELPRLQGKEHETEFQVIYRPKSKGPIIDETLIPRTMSYATAEALDNLEKEVGDIDEYVRDKLQYASIADLHKAFSADQVDAIALIISNLEKGGVATVEGDQTGIGKGRVAAAIYHYARLQGKIPIFFTEKANLFSDFYRDMTDIGQPFNPLIIASDKAKATITDQKGNVVMVPLVSDRRTKMLNEIIDKGLEAITDYDGIVTTYSQINKPNKVQQALEKIIPGNYVIMDESHNASGTDSNTFNYLFNQLQAAKGVTYLSATFAKRPDTMPIYFRTDISKANLSMEELIEAVVSGGTPLQEIMSTYLAKRGQLVRREKSFRGITVETYVDTKNRARDVKRADEVTELLRDILAFDKRFVAEFNAIVNPPKGERGQRKGPPGEVFGIRIPGGGDISAGGRNRVKVTTTNFASIVHNAVRTLMLCMKVNLAVEQALKSLKEGKKPVIALANTLGSFLEYQIEEAGYIRVGDPMGSMTYADILKKYLQGCLTIKVKEPGQRQGTTYQVRLENLPPALQQAYRKVEEKIEKFTTDIPASPIDSILKALKDKGYKVAEITGRKYVADLEEDGMPIRRRSDKEINDRNAIIRGFNNGEIDALVINQAGAAGLSLHASPKFKDQRPRIYICAQQELNIDTEVQKMGRINRKGQVVTPSYLNLQLDLPAELRPAAIHMKKMRSLSANTSANADSPLAQKEIPDIFNKYGDEIVEKWLEANPEIQGRMNLGGKARTGIALAATGKISLEPVALQERFYKEIESAYNERIEQLKEDGLYDLDVDYYDFKARMVQSKILTVGNDETNPFGKSTRLEELHVKSTKKPYTRKQLEALIDKKLKRYNGSQTDLMNAKVEELEEKVNEYISEIENRDITEEKKATLREAVKSRFNKTRWSLKNKYIIGRTYEISLSPDFKMQGVLIDVALPTTLTSNPANPGRIRLRFAVNNALRTYSCSLNQAETNDISVWEINRNIPKNWDETVGPDVRVTRYMITGNIIQGFADAPAGAKIVRFTMEDGRTREGILMPLSYSMVDVAKQTVRVTADILGQLLAKHAIDEIVGTNIAIDWDEWKRLYRITVSKTKKRGGKYFLDDILISLTVAQGFETSGIYMVAHVNEENIMAFVQRLYELGDSFSVPAAIYEHEFGKGPQEPSSTSMQVKRKEPPATPWPKDFPVIIPQTTIKAMRAHPDFKAAKAGDMEAAQRLVGDLIKPAKIQALGKRHPDAIIVPVRAQEATGRNMIPEAYARAIKKITGLEVNDDIVQANFVGHTGAGALTRLVTPAIFEGTVEPGREYIIVDDVVTSGGTIRSLRNYIESRGGKVVEVSAMGLAQFAGRLAPSQATLDKIEANIGRDNLERILEEHGITGGLESLTQSQLRELSRYKDVDRLRDRLVKARVSKSRKTGRSLLRAKVRPSTRTDALEAAKATEIIRRVLKDVLPASVLKDVTVKLRPNLTMKDLLRIVNKPDEFARSLREHGGNIAELLGVTQVKNMRALIVMSLATNKKAFEATGYHEAFHVAAKLLLPEKDYQALMDFYEGNEEDAANDFARFALEKKAKTLAKKPSFVRKIFMYLNKIFTAIRAKLGDKGARVQQVFDRILAKQYRRLPRWQVDKRLIASAAKQREMAPPFYSKLLKVVTTAKDMPAKTQSLLKWLQRKQVKPEELRWYGVEEWIKENQKDGKIDREAFVNFLKANELMIHEIVKEPISPEERYQGYEDKVEWEEPYMVDEDDEESWIGDEYIGEYEIEGYFDGPEGYVANFRIYGNDDWGWRLHVVVENGEGRVVQETDEPVDSVDQAKDMANDIAAETYDKIIETKTKYEQYSLFGTDFDYREALFILPKEIQPHEYESSHWDEPNVLAHARYYADARTIEGDKVLYVDEVQSDWHQEGKKKGYAKPITPDDFEIKILPWEEAKKELHPTLAEVAERHGREYRRERGIPVDAPVTIFRLKGGKKDDWVVNHGEPPDDIQRFLWEQITQATSYPDTRIGEEIVKRQGRVPPAPFTESWPLFVLKRMLRHAAELGADYLAWSPGEIQIERYNLRKYINRIDFMKQEDGDIWIRVEDIYGNTISRIPSVMDEQTLEEWFGKDIAKKIVSSAKVGDPQSLENVDLEIGGEGMIEFYDNKLVGMMRKYVKQWGSKVVEIQLEPFRTKTFHAVPITPQMREDVLYTGQVMFKPARVPENEYKQWAQQYIKEILEAGTKPAATKERKQKVERIKEEQKYLAENWHKNLFEAGKTVIKQYPKIAKSGWLPERPDTTFLERLLQSPEFYFEKVPAAQRVLEARLEKPENFRRHLADITEHDRLIEQIKLLKKENKEEYTRLKKLIKHADQYKKIYKAEDLKEMGFSDLGIKAWQAYRQIMNHGFDKLYAEMLDIIQSYEKAGLEVPKVVTWVDGKRVKIDLKVALAMMGDMRGYYAPRIRKPGRWMIIGTKKGAHTRMEFRDSKAAANLLHAKWAAEGYTVTKQKTKSMPEDVFEMAGRTIALGAMVNEAFERVARMEKEARTLEDFGLQGEWAGKEFQVRGPYSKRMTEVFKALGGRFYDMAWHFHDAPKDFESRLTDALNNMVAGIGPFDTEPLFAYSIAMELANIVKGRGFRSRMIKRHEGVGLDVWEGYEEDPLTAAAQYAASIAAGLAKKEMAAQMVKAVTGTDIDPSNFPSYEEYLEEVKRRRIDPAKQRNIYHDVKVYMEEQLRNQEFVDRVIGMVKALAVLKYLGFRVAAPVVNLTALLTSVPATLNEYAGVPWKRIPALMAKAASLYAKYKFGNRAELPPEVVSMFDVFEQRGWTEAQFRQEALAVIQSKVGAATRDLISASMYMFGTTERMNRAITLAAAYLGAREGGSNAEEAFKKAKKTSDRAHGIYMGNAALPHFAQGQNPAAYAMKMFYVFSKFSHTYLQTMYELGWKKRNRRALLYMLFAPAIIGGAGSMAGWSVLMAILKKLFDRDDPEEEFYKTLGENFDPWLEYLARHGLLGAFGYGVSLKNSLAIDPVGSIPTTIPELLGAPGSIYTDIKQGVQEARKGQWGRAMEKVLPRAAGGILQAIREHRYGVTTVRGVPKMLHGKPMRPTPLDTFYRVLNFNPSHLAAMKEQKWAETKLIKEYQRRRSDIYERLRHYYSVPYTMRSRAEYEDILQDIREYNDRVTTGKLYRIKGISFITRESIRAALRQKR